MAPPCETWPRHGSGQGLLSIALFFLLCLLPHLLESPFEQRPATTLSTLCFLGWPIPPFSRFQSLKLWKLWVERLSAQTIIYGTFSIFSHIPMVEMFKNKHIALTYFVLHCTLDQSSKLKGKPMNSITLIWLLIARFTDIE